jgi:hypothetical protein
MSNFFYLLRLKGWYYQLGLYIEYSAYLRSKGYLRQKAELLHGAIIRRLECC